MFEYVVIEEVFSQLGLLHPPKSRHTPSKQLMEEKVRVNSQTDRQTDTRTASSPNNYDL